MVFAVLLLRGALRCSRAMQAVASSYTFEEGERDHPADSIYVRTMAEVEIKPKSKA